MKKPGKHAHFRERPTESSFSLITFEGKLCVELSQLVARTLGFLIPQGRCKLSALNSCSFLLYRRAAGAIPTCKAQKQCKRH